MSGSVPTIPFPPTPVRPSVSLRDQVVRDAQSLPDLITRAQVLDPPLAQALTQQAATASSTPLGALVAAAITWGIATYGIGWDPHFVDLLAGLAVVGGGYASHYIQAWVQKKPPLVEGKPQ